MNTKTFLSLTAIALFAMTLSVGCGNPNDASGIVADRNNTNVARVRNCYNLYISYNQRQPPKNKEELIEFLSKPGFKDKLKMGGIDQDALADIFISERDNEEIKVRWGKGGGLVDAPIAFESVGVDGKRLVGFAVPREVGDSEYDDLWSGKIKGESAKDAFKDSDRDASKGSYHSNSAE